MVSKKKRNYRLLVSEVHDIGGGEMMYTFYDTNKYDIYEEYKYRGSALNLRGENGHLRVGDIIELDAKHETNRFKRYCMKLKEGVRVTWLSYPSNKKLVT